MANPTTNFGWVMPTSTSLVTNLPADFNTFGQAVDTSMAQLKGGTTGQVLSKTSATDMAFTWVTPTDQTPLTTKGDLFTFTTVDARLAVGNNGETLVADSSTSTGLRWQGNYAAGKNKIINGDFGVWQRGTSFVSIADNVYFADRFKTVLGGAGTATYSRQTFTAGTAPVAGYEGNFFARASVSSGTGTTVMGIAQPIEDVRTFAGQTVTLSFWAKADSARTATVFLVQNFGAGGSANVNLSTTIAVTTAWTRFSYTVTLGSMSGKTIGTNSVLQAEVDFLSGQGSGSPQLDLWGVQVEAGSVATAFQTATGTIQGELAACQRYYFRSSGGSNYAFTGINGMGNTTTQMMGFFSYPVAMRIAPSSVDYSNIAIYDTVTVLAVSSITISDATTTGIRVLVNTATASVQAWRPNFVINNNNTAGYLALNAEL